MRTPLLLLLWAFAPHLFGQTNVYMNLMQAAQTRTSAHGASVHAAISDGNDAILSGKVPVEDLHRGGHKVIGGISDDPEQLHDLVRAGIDGYITDRPDILIDVLQKEISLAKTAEEKRRLKDFDVEAHRGGRGLRPENTLPSFENGLDLGVTTLEMDTGVSADNVAIVWHDEYFDSKMCRRVDGRPYDANDHFWIRDKSAAEIQQQLICDKTPFSTTQQSDVSLSPVSVAFARKEHLANPYSPVTIDQIFRFVRFYASYYRSGPGREDRLAKERAAEGERVRFDLETKLIPDFLPSEDGKLERTKNHTAEPKAFVQALCPAILRNHMQERSEVQSFDFRTLKLVEEQFPFLPTYYLTSNPKLLQFQTEVGMGL
ncbi:glycerophosphodiester phosphodiesterase family protein [Granulicella sp. WH15]|uniref:glycerophosphodiester phosphodiesterase family protein n=1 Tax=Granulicella sp. WH15 TaxID=2602070 RepID=UPI0013A5A50F|nr:glycerophosphodiester phosphodiesterase family protein [Granulicella sp. WH15]